MVTGADQVDIAIWGGPGALVVIDPPYDGTEGYGPYELSRRAVLQLARAWAWSGSRVVLCEAVPLCKVLGPGWYSTRIDSKQSGRGRNNYGATQEWVTTNFHPEKVPEGCQILCWKDQTGMEASACASL